MSVDITAPNIALSPAYLHAQRVMARWLEAREAGARRARFALRTAWTPLDATEHDRLVRWLAWLRLAASSHGDTRLETRIQQLDVALDLAITRAMRTLPGQRHVPHGRRLRSA